MSAEEFRIYLSKYFRDGCLKKSDKLVSLIFPYLPFRLNAKKMAKNFKKLSFNSEVFSEIEIKIEGYAGDNVFAKKISRFLHGEIGDKLIGAYVHGSIGTGEEISYSDFDGLVIIRNKVIKSPRELGEVAIALKQSEEIIYEMDKLQHHGWFVIAENELLDFPEYYFPHDLFSYSKCLFGEKDIAIKLRTSGYQHQFQNSFRNLSLSILKKLESRRFLDNYYFFKNLLSEFMLLPSMYIQAKTGKGIFKKNSFKKVSDEIGDQYLVMNEVSLMRQNWNYIAPTHYKILNKIKRIVSAKLFSGKLPDELKIKFDSNMINRMISFVKELTFRLEEQNKIGVK